MEIPATIAAWDGDQLTVWDKVQGIHYSQRPTATRWVSPPLTFASSRRSSAARSAAPARRGHTNSWPPTPPGSCAARSNSLSPGRRCMPQSDTGPSAGRESPSLPTEPVPSPPPFTKARSKFRGTAATKTPPPREPNCSTRRRPSALRCASCRSTPANPPTCAARRSHRRVRPGMCHRRAGRTPPDGPDRTATAQ